MRPRGKPRNSRDRGYFRHLETSACTADSLRPEAGRSTIMFTPSILTDPLKKHYDKRIIDELHALADFYGYRTGVGSLLAAAQ